jgi:hypothetical protein
MVYILTMQTRVIYAEVQVVLLLKQQMGETAGSSTTPEQAALFMT